MKIDLREKILSNYDEYLKEELRKQWDDSVAAGFDQYNLLAHLSTYFNNDVIVDIGTGHSAVSARALAYNKTNKVISYDTEFNANARDHIERLDNVEYDVFNPIKSPNDRDVMLSASLISLDVDPHDGEQENEFYSFFVDNDWKGIMVCDDIWLGRDATGNNITMALFWEYVDKPKYDLTDTRYSHSTGTGIICFDNQEIILSEEEYQKNHNPAKWVHGSLDRNITRYDDGTFETNDGVTGIWDHIVKKDTVKKTSEEFIVLKTWAGKLEIPISVVGYPPEAGSMLEELGLNWRQPPELGQTDEDER